MCVIMWGIFFVVLYDFESGFYVIQAALVLAMKLWVIVNFYPLPANLEEPHNIVHSSVVGTFHSQTTEAPCVGV